MKINALLLFLILIPYQLFSDEVDLLAEFPSLDYDVSPVITDFHEFYRNPDRVEVTIFEWAEEELEEGRFRHNLVGEHGPYPVSIGLWKGLEDEVVRKFYRGVGLEAFCFIWPECRFDVYQGNHKESITVYGGCKFISSTSSNGVGLIELRPHQIRSLIRLADHSRQFSEERNSSPEAEGDRK